MIIKATKASVEPIPIKHIYIMHLDYFSKSTGKLLWSSKLIRR